LKQAFIEAALKVREETADEWATNQSKRLSS
jgi:hypothetical protein